MPFSKLPSPPRLGVLTSDHAVPSQCSTYGMWKFMSLTLPSLPEAHASLPDSAVTPVSSFRLMLLPEQADTFVPSKHGAGTMRQVVPSQWAVKFAVAFGSATVPTTHTSFAAVAVTALGSMKQSAALGSQAWICVGKGTIFQAVPSKCSKSTLSWVASALSWKPAAHRSSGPVPPTADRSPVAPAGRLGPLTIDQRVPFQCSIRGWSSMLPSPALPFPLVPTAQASAWLSSSTPARPACLPGGVGAATREKADPSQCSTSGWPNRLLRSCHPRPPARA